MRIFTALIIVSILLTGCSPGEQSTTEGDKKPSIAVANTVYTNGRIYTANDAQPWAEAVAIEDTRFVAVGSIESVTELVGDKTTVVDLGGKLVLPGFIDNHTHAVARAVPNNAGLRGRAPRRQIPAHRLRLGCEILASACWPAQERARQDIWRTPRVSGAGGWSCVMDE